MAASIAAMFEPAVAQEGVAAEDTLEWQFLDYTSGRWVPVSKRLTEYAPEVAEQWFGFTATYVNGELIHCEKVPIDTEGRNYADGEWVSYSNLEGATLHEGDVVRLEYSIGTEKIK